MLKYAYLLSGRYGLAKGAITLTKRGSKSSSKNRQSVQNEHPSIEQRNSRSAAIWGLVVALTLFWIWAPFQQALFNGQWIGFEKPVYWAGVGAATIGLAVLAVFAKSIRIVDQRGITAVWVWLLPFCYILSSFGAASHDLAVNMIVVTGICAAFFTIGLFLLQHPTASRAMRAALLWTTYLIVIYGLINWFGQRLFAGAIVDGFSPAVRQGMYEGAVMTDSNGLRLTSVFQYANTYAAFLMAMLFAVLFTASRPLRRYDRFMHGFMLVPIILSIALTLSRGGLVLLPIVFVALLLLLKPAQQGLWIFNLTVSAVISLSVLQPITALGLRLNQTYNGGEAFEGWALVIAASAANAVLIELSWRYLRPLFERKLAAGPSRRWASLRLPLGGLAFVAVLAFLFVGTGLKQVLPDSIRTRVETINWQQHSVLERLTFYKDSLKLAADYPILGGGGGAWSAMYGKYQNNPYISNQTHNYFLQVLDETGLIGLIALLSFLLYIFVQYLRSYRREQDEEKKEGSFFYFLIAFSILVHSLLDFNMSYVYIGVLVFFSLGGMAAFIPDQPLRRRPKSEASKSKHKKSSIPAASLSYVIAAGTLATILLVFSARQVAAAGSYEEAVRLLNSSESRSYEQLRTLLDDALAVRPTSPATILQTAALLQSVYRNTQDVRYLNDAEVLLSKAYQKEPYNKDILNQLAAVYATRNETQKSFELLADNLEKFNWDMKQYEQVIGQAAAVSLSLAGKDTSQQTAVAERGVEAYDRMLTNIAHLQTLPPGQLQGREFAVTPSIRLSAGKAMYLGGQTERSADLLKGLLTSDVSSEADLEAARWYLIALRKLGRDDPFVYNKLIAADPASKEQIEAISKLF